MTGQVAAYADLHIHSHHSDGLHAPGELVRMARDLGVRAIALADHDSVDGIDEALAQGLLLGVEVIPAVELSVDFRGYNDVHLLGYFIDHRDPAFRARLAQFRDSRRERGRAIVERINARLARDKRGTISYEEVLAAAGGAVGRPHIGRILMEKGLVKTMEDAFSKFLEPCNVPKRRMPMAEALAELKRIGGVAVLAHPQSLSSDRPTVQKMLRELAAMGLDGVEVFSNMCYKEEDIVYFNNLATQLGLVPTGGSDFHGFEDDAAIGRLRGGANLPYRLVESLREVKERNGRPEVAA